MVRAYGVALGTRRGYVSNSLTGSVKSELFCHHVVRECALPARLAPPRTPEDTVVVLIVSERNAVLVMRSDCVATVAGTVGTTCANSRPGGASDMCW